MCINFLFCTNLRLGALQLYHDDDNDEFVKLGLRTVTCSCLVEAQTKARFPLPELMARVNGPS